MHTFYTKYTHTAYIYVNMRHMGKVWPYVAQRYFLTDIWYISQKARADTILAIAFMLFNNRTLQIGLWCSINSGSSTTALRPFASVWSVELLGWVSLITLGSQPWGAWAAVSFYFKIKLNDFLDTLIQKIQTFIIELNNVRGDCRIFPAKTATLVSCSLSRWCNFIHEDITRGASDHLRDFMKVISSAKNGSVDWTINISRAVFWRYSYNACSSGPQLHVGVLLIDI